jgi:hypothetical protein
VAKTQTLRNAYGFGIGIRPSSECPHGSAIYDGVLGHYIHLQRSGEPCTTLAEAVDRSGVSFRRPLKPCGSVSCLNQMQARQWLVNLLSLIANGARLSLIRPIKGFRIGESATRGTPGFKNG